MSEKEKKSLSYRDAGVDLDAAHEVVNRYKTKAEGTRRPGVIGEIGGFGGLFSLKEAAPDIEDPILVSGTDGVGTKLKLAFELDKHDTIGIDLVAMCVNDIVTVGAKPLFFLDYLATGKLEPTQAEAIVGGIAQGCKEADCALIGGETAEMPGFYSAQEYDIAGFAVGVVDRNRLLNRDHVKEGDLLIGVQSSGFHSNGYSLIRKIINDNELDLYKKYEGLEQSLGEELLTPTLIYTKLALALIHEAKVKSLAHITGGGIYENLPRSLPEGVGAQLELSNWKIPPIIDFICKRGNVLERERYRVFNMGIGLIAVVSQEMAEKGLEIINCQGFTGGIIGKIKGKTIDIQG